MKPHLSKRLIIDTDILAAATDSPALRARICQKVLSTVLALCHKIVITEKLRKEHSKRRFPRWLRSWILKMSDNGKLIREDHLQTDRPRDLKLAIKNCSLSGNAKKRMLRDEHLIDAALWTDKRVLSMDNTVLGDFRKLSDTIIRIREILWLNPEKQEKECLSWLESGAPIVDKYYLNKN